MSEGQFLSAVEAIYDAAPDPSRWPRTLQAISDCFGDAGAILIYGKDDGAFGVIESPSITPLISEYARDWSRRDIRAIRSRERGYFLRHDVITDRDILTADEMKTDPFYADFLAKHGLKYFAAAMVSPDPRVEVALSVQRRSDKAEYSEGELVLLGRLGRHIERSLRLGIRLLDAELVNVGLGVAFARIGIGVFALDSLGRIVFSNPFGQKLLGDGVDVVNERFLFTASERGEAEAAIRSALNDNAAIRFANPKPVLLHRRASGQRLALYVLPIGVNATAAHRFLTQARAIVLVVDSEAGVPPDPAVVRDILGLTLSEARIASLIGSGLAPREAAEKLGITEETTRTALKRVFSKVGVSRQSELAALMTRLVLR